MRTPTICLLATLTACSSSTSPRSHASLNTARSALLAADSSLSATTASQGIATGLSSGLADSAIYEQTGEPIIVGRANIQSTLQTLYAPPGYSLTWQTSSWRYDSRARPAIPDLYRVLAPDQRNVES